MTERLKELENEGIIFKKISNGYNTEYFLTERGFKLNKIIFEFFDFALDEINENDPELNEQSKEEIRSCLKID